MNNLYITCDTIEQRQDVMDILDNAGFKMVGTLVDTTNDIQTAATAKAYANTSIRNTYEHPYQPQITYTQFMEKYAVNKLTNKINEAMTELKISKAELSRRIGKHRNYLGSIQQFGATTKKQNEIITALDKVIAGTFKTDGEVIAELSSKLAEMQDHLREATVNNGFIAEKVISLETANKELMQESDGYHNANNDLNAELNTMRKIAQERAETIERINNDLTYIKEENDKLSEIASIQQDVNVKLNTENTELLESHAGKVNEISKLNKSLSNQKMDYWTLVFVYSLVSVALTYWWM